MLGGDRLRWFWRRAGRALPSDESRGRRESADDAWDRGAPVWRLLFYATLALATVFTLSDASVSPSMRVLALALSLSWAGWHRLYAGKLEWRSTALLPHVVYIAVTMLLWLALALVHPAYFFTTYSVYWQTFTLLPTPWALPISLIYTALIGLRNFLVEPGANLWGILLYVGVSAFFGTLFTVWLSRIIEQSAERRELIEELERARAHLAAEERRAGTLEERQRLAGEIHDTLAQGFASIVMQLEAAEQALPPGADPSRAHLVRARRTARSSLSEARRLVWALQPPELEAAPLPAALRRVAARWAEETGMRAEVTITGALKRLPPETEVTLLRAAQEGLANVRKHARASRVDLTLSYMADVVTLDLRDDGAGIVAGSADGAARAGGGYGLRAMRERALSLGGRLGLESERGEGTTLVLELPSGDETAATQEPRPAEAGR